jgi:hypothetical protein
MARVLLGRVSGYSAYETWAHLPENAGKSESDFFEFLVSSVPGSPGHTGVVVKDSFTDFPTMGFGQTLYVALDTSSVYGWFGSVYVLVGTGDYSRLKNKPALNGVPLSSESTSTELGLASSASLSGVKTSLDGHLKNSSNPHSVTKSQVGLGAVDNTSDADKPVSAAQQTALDGKVNKVSGKGLSANDFTDGYKSQLDHAPENINSELADLAEEIDDNGIASGSLSASTMAAVKVTLTKGDGSVLDISLSDLANILLKRSADHPNGETSLGNGDSGHGFSALSTEVDTNSVGGFETNTGAGDPVVAGFFLRHNVNVADSVHVLLMNDGVGKSAYLVKNKAAPTSRGQVAHADEMLNRGEVEGVINGVVAAAMSGVLPVPVILRKESDLPDISEGSDSVQYFVVEEMDVTSDDAVRQGRAWCGVGETSWHVLLDLVNALSTDSFEQRLDGEWVIAEEVQRLIDGSVQGSQILTTEPTAGSTDSQVVGGKLLWGMFGGALSTLKTTAKTVVGALNELFDSVAAKYTKPSMGIPASDIALTDGQWGAVNSGITTELVSTFGEKYAKPDGGIPTSDLALSQGQGDALNSGITSTLVSTFGGKQDALDSDQLDAVNSGITSELVARIGSVEGGNLSYIFNTEDEYLEARDGIPDGSRVLIIEG